MDENKIMEVETVDVDEVIVETDDVETTDLTVMDFDSDDENGVNWGAIGIAVAAVGGLGVAAVKLAPKVKAKIADLKAAHKAKKELKDQPELTYSDEDDIDFDDVAEDIENEN